MNMYLSTITTAGSATDYHCHQVVKHMFKDSTRPLFRTLYAAGTKYIRVLSDKHAASDKAFDGSKMVSSKEVSSLPGKTVNFYLKVNPTRSVRVGERKSTKQGIIDPNAVTEWLQKKMRGCSIIEHRVSPAGLQKIPEKGTSAYIHEVSGVIEITNLEEFTGTLINGLGSSKFIGCGMIDVW